MDVASERHDALLVEYDRAVLLPLLELELEPFGRREGIDMMTDGIVVEEAHPRPDRHYRHERLELNILLVDRVATADSRHRYTGIVDGHDRVGDWRAVGAAHLDVEIDCSRAAAAGEGNRKGDDAKRNHGRSLT